MAHNNTERWMGTWSASPQPPYPEGVSSTGFRNQTIRQIIHPHMDGSNLRIHLSNIFGSDPLQVEEVYVAYSAGGAKVIPETNRQVTFHGSTSAVIPHGEKMMSDPISLEVKHGHDMTISIYIPASSGPTTWHSWGRQTSYVASGNETSDKNGRPFQAGENSRFWLERMEVMVDSTVKGAIVTLGDSITDVGHSTLNANRRWPDVLAGRFNRFPLHERYAVLNAGISGNQLLRASINGGHSALERLDRDVFSQSGITDVILLEGINDIIRETATCAGDIIAGMKQIIERTHARGLRIYGGTLTPFGGYRTYSSESEAIREGVNHWIRTSHAFDGIIDFDEAVRDPQHPHQMLPAYHAGDWLHPGDAGLEAMANCIDLAMF